MGIDPLSLAAYAGIASAAVGAYSAVTAPGNKPQIQAPNAPPQAAKAPDAGSIHAGSSNAMLGAMTGAKAAPTFLTGPSGVDPLSLNLGKSTLLGQ